MPKTKATSADSCHEGSNSYEIEFTLEPSISCRHFAVSTMVLRYLISVSISASTAVDLQYYAIFFENLLPLNQNKSQQIRKFSMHREIDVVNYH